jgi:hypothetical protein
MTGVASFLDAAAKGISLPYLLLLAVLALVLAENIVLIVMETRRGKVRAKRRALALAARAAAQAPPEIPPPVMKVTKHRCKIDGEMFVHVFDVELLTTSAPARVTIEADAANTYAISMGAVGEKFEDQTAFGGALPIMSINQPARTFQVNVWSRNGIAVPEIAARVE